MIDDEAFEAETIGRTWKRVKGCVLCNKDGEAVCSRCVFMFQLKIVSIASACDLEFIVDHCHSIMDEMVQTGKVFRHINEDTQDLMCFTPESLPKLMQFSQ